MTIGRQQSYLMKSSLCCTSKLNLSSNYGARFSRIWAIRVCQPAPLARQRETTSGGNRRLIATFGFSIGGLPTRFLRRLRTAFFSISSVNSGRSWSGLLEERRVLLDFSGIALPHRNDSSRTSTRCVRKHHHSIIEMSDTENSTL